MKIFNKLYTVKEEKETQWNGDIKTIKIIKFLGIKFKIVTDKGSDAAPNSSRVKFFIAYHMPSQLFKNAICVPIHLGRKLARQKSKDGKIDKSGYKWMLKNMIGDDTGDNISEMNRNLNEMTGIYWVWRNYDRIGNPDYIGFMHYRTVFAFSDYPEYNFNYMTSIGYTEDNLLALMKENDFIFGKFYKHPVSNKEFLSTIHYKDGIRKTMFEKMCRILMQKHQQEYMLWAAGNLEGPLKNMFMTSKKMFFEYCNWIFPILFELYDEFKHYTPKNSYEERTLGYIAETLTAFYLFMMSKKYRYKEMPLVRPVINGFVFKISDYRQKYVKYRVLGIFIKKYKSKAKLFKQAIS